MHPFEKKDKTNSLSHSIKCDETESSFSSGIDSDMDTSTKQESKDASIEQFEVKTKEEDIPCDSIKYYPSKLEDEPQNDSLSNSDNESSNDEHKDTGDYNTQDSELETVTSPVENMLDNTKADIMKALEEGKTCQERIMAQIRETDIISSKVTEEYEKYSAENMDDLFEDDSSEDNRVFQHNNVSYKYYSKSSPIERNEVLPDIKHLTNTPSHSDYESDNVNQSFQSDSSTRLSENDQTSDGMSSHRKKSITNYSNIDAKKLEALKNEAYHRHLKGVSEDVHMYMEKLQVLFTIAYEELNSPEGRDQCYATLEEAFFTPIWQYLLALFR